jgi:hypothetical protein
MLLLDSLKDKLVIWGFVGLMNEDLGMDIRPDSGALKCLKALSASSRR